MPTLFGTDGIRGIANQSLTPETAMRIGRAGAFCLAAGFRPDPTPGRGRPLLVLGRDSRLSGDLLASAVTAGCLSTGVDVVDLGIIPTPGVAYLTRHLGAAGGVVISASHNPVDDNGIKFFDAKGYKLSPEVEDQIEAKLGQRQDRLPRPVGDGVGARVDGGAYIETYASHLLSTVEGSLEGMRVVVDAAYGATAGLASSVLARAGAEVVAINDVFDGRRINVDCGSTSPEAMAAAVRENRATAGLAFDGDGDRVIASDEKGHIVDGDQILAILGGDMARRGALANDTVVATVMSNLGLELALREAGVRMIRAAVGDRSVLLEMLGSGAVLGGEQSGHVIMLRHATTGDGILTGLSLLGVVARTGRKMSELAAKVVKLPQVLVNVKVRNKDGLQTSEKVATAIERVREALGHTGRVLVRPSGTEPIVRIMVEGQDEARIREMAERLRAVVAAELGGETGQGR